MCNSKFKIAANYKESKMMARNRRTAEFFLKFKRWTPKQREILQDMSKRGYLVADIWTILDAFGMMPSYMQRPHQAQRGIVMIWPDGFKSEGKNLKKEINFCLL